MADELTTGAAIPDEFTTLYEALKAKLLADAPTMDYTPQSRAELRAQLQASLQPNLDSSIRQRQLTTERTSAAADADAAARGIGASTWGSDVKARAADAEAADIASMKGDYNATLASNLTSRLSDQESNALAADQYNKTSRGNALANALQLALQQYANWSTTAVDTGSSDGSGSTVSKDFSGTTLADKLKKLTAMSGYQSDDDSYTGDYAGKKPLFWGVTGTAGVK